MIFAELIGSHLVVILDIIIWRRLWELLPLFPYSFSSTFVLEQPSLDHLALHSLTMTSSPDDPIAARQFSMIARTPSVEGALLVSLAKNIKGLVHKFNDPPPVLSPLPSSLRPPPTAMRGP